MIFSNLDNFHPIELGAVTAVSLDSAISHNQLTSWDSLTIAKENSLIVTGDATHKVNIPLLTEHATDNLNIEFDLITDATNKTT
jgi:hypothetical protein